MAEVLRPPEATMIICVTANWQLLESVRNFRVSLPSLLVRVPFGARPLDLAHRLIRAHLTRLKEIWIEDRGRSAPFFFSSFVRGSAAKG